MRRPVITVGFRDGSPPPAEEDGFAVAHMAGLAPSAGSLRTLRAGTGSPGVWYEVVGIQSMTRGICPSRTSLPIRLPAAGDVCPCRPNGFGAWWH